MEPSDGGTRLHLRPPCRKTTLPNGVRVLTEHLDHVDSVSLGVWVDSGLAGDPPGGDGMTHLLEHMLFKATRKRSSRRIAETIDDVGGNVNGLTDREFMYLYARTARSTWRWRSTCCSTYC